MHNQLIILGFTLVIFSNISFQTAQANTRCENLVHEYSTYTSKCIEGNTAACDTLSALIQAVQEACTSPSGAGCAAAQEREKDYELKCQYGNLRACDMLSSARTEVRQRCQ